MTNTGYEYRIVADGDATLFESKSLDATREMLDGWRARKVLRENVAARIERRPVGEWEEVKA